MSNKQQITIKAVEGENLIHITDRQKDKLVDVDLIHYNGTQWLFFDEDKDKILEFISEKDQEDEYYTSEDPRFNFMDLDEETNKPDLQKWVENDELVGLVDEECGGIIGYVNPAHADKLYSILNAQKYKRGEGGDKK